MEPLRSSSQHGSGKSEAHRERSHADTAMQNAANTMIAVTESFRHHLHQQQYAALPGPPARSYTLSRTHSRASTSSSTSSQRLIDYGPVRQASFSNLSWSSTPQYRTGSLQDEPLSARTSDSGSSYTLLQPEQEPEPEREVARMMIHIPNDIIRLSSPNLPERLVTPHTPTSHGYRTSDPTPFSDSNSVPAARLSEAAFNDGGLVQATRRLDAFREGTYEYMPLRPDCGTETRRFGTVTHIRAGSEQEAFVPNPVRRKPLDPSAKTLRFNHSFTNEIFFVVVICLAQVLALAGFSQTLIPARQVAESFPEQERTPGHLAWYTVAYALGAGAFVLPGHRLGRIFGHKFIFVLGYFWFALWSFLAGLSVYIKVNGGACTIFFCFCRGMQGIGPALLIPNGQALLQRAYPPSPRKKIVMGLFDAATPLGFVLGSVMTSLFGHFACWPWAFYSLATVCLAATALSMVILPRGNVLIHDLKANLLHRLDILGIICGIAGLIIFCAGWSQAPIVSFTNAQAYVLLAVGVVLIVLFVFAEARASHPLVPVKQMQASAAVALGCISASWAGFGVWVWYLIQFMEVLRGWDALRLSSGFIPLLVVGIITAVVCSQFVTKKLAAHGALVVSSIAVLLSSILMATAPEKQSYWLNTFFSIFIMPIGLVTSIPATVGVLAQSLPHGHQGLAGGLTATMTGYALSISLGMAGVIERDIRNKGATTLEGYRSAQYLGLGLGGLSVVLAVGLLFVAFFRR
ncbi:major facilitator superfamily-domain-containing protein [Dactylonectria macrodidyma]|uniref:Major facilitator superfamily-domain-containing protein n=1 Tax=Dactylonectria macrodidyma TaxID=307937 RepID=A0A9P9FAM0_9HYPO|nr:major facilitator superfamily-domain-containing protein [Dactylonectria macrodidyma]